MGYREYQDDCMHLKACRRLCKIAKKELKKTLVRRCDETCTAYESSYDYVSRSRAEDAVRGAIDALEYGESPDDVCVEYRL